MTFDVNMYPIHLWKKTIKTHPSATETPKMALEIWSLGFQQIQSILGSSNQKEPIIMTIFTLTSSCPIPLCASCKIPHLTRRTPMSSAVSHNFSQLATLRRDDLTVGQKVSLEHMFHPLLDAYHKLRARNHLLCISPVERSSWNIAQKFIFIYIQVLLGTGELVAKNELNQHFGPLVFFIKLLRRQWCLCLSSL